MLLEGPDQGSSSVITLREVKASPGLPDPVKATTGNSSTGEAAAGSADAVKRPIPPMTTQRHGDPQPQQRPHELSYYESKLVIEKASVEQGGIYTCSPSNTNNATVRVHITQGIPMCTFMFKVRLQNTKYFASTRCLPKSQTIVLK